MHIFLLQIADIHSELSAIQKQCKDQPALKNLHSKDPRAKKGTGITVSKQQTTVA